jgi:hypothetical protein
MALKKLLVLLGLCSGAVLAAETLDVGRFVAAQATPPAPWQVLRFDTKVAPTLFRLRDWDGVVAVEALANASMALLARPLTVDLQRTPILCWRWRVDAPLRNADMATKAGDDYAARVYLAFSLPAAELSMLRRFKLALARSRYGELVPDAALNYVWDNRYPIGTQQPNAYTDRAQMWVLRSGATTVGGWVSERRDVLADAQQAFGTQQVQARLLAVGSDTDNAGEQAHAGFAELHFVPSDQPCRFSSARR